MNVEIGTETAQFPEKEYTNGIFVAVQPVPAPYVIMCLVTNHYGLRRVWTLRTLIYCRTPRPLEAIHSSVLLSR